MSSHVDLVGEDAADAHEGQPLSKTHSRMVTLRRHNASLGIGVKAAPVTAAVIETFGPLLSVVEADVAAEEVAVVHSVDPAAALAGKLVPGDLIVAVGDAETAGLPIDEVCDLLAAAPDGTSITIVRVGQAAGSKQLFSDASAAPGRTIFARIERGATGVFGVDFEKVAASDGIVVHAVSPASPAGLAGILRPGDVITAIDGVNLAGLNVEAATANVRGKPSVAVELVRRSADTSDARAGRAEFAAAASSAKPKASAPPERALRLRPSALELPPLAASGRGARLSATWGQRMAALRSLPPHLYLRDDPPHPAAADAHAGKFRAEPEAEWWVPQAERGGGAPPRDVCALLDAGLAHVATGGLPCRRSTFVRIVREASPQMLVTHVQRPLFEEAAARSRGAAPLARGEAAAILLASDYGYLSRTSSTASLRPFLDLVRDWVASCADLPRGSIALPEVPVLSWAQFEAFFRAWHAVFGAAELAWLLASLCPLIFGVVPARADAQAAYSAPLMAPLDIDAWLGACAALEGDVWVVDGVEILVPPADEIGRGPAADSLDGLAAAAAAASSADPEHGRSTQWYEHTLTARCRIVVALKASRPASPHAVFIAGRGLERPAEGASIRPPPPPVPAQPPKVLLQAEAVPPSGGLRAALSQQQQQQGPPLRAPT